MITLLMFVSCIPVIWWCARACRRQYFYTEHKRYSIPDIIICFILPAVVSLSCGPVMNKSMAYRFPSEVVKSSSSYEEVRNVDSDRNKTIYYWKVNPDGTETYITWERTMWSKFQHTKDPNSSKSYLVTTPAVYHPNYLYALWPLEMNEYEFREGTKK